MAYSPYPNDYHIWQEMLRTLERNLDLRVRQIEEDLVRRMHGYGSSLYCPPSNYGTSPVSSAIVPFAQVSMAAYTQWSLDDLEEKPRTKPQPLMDEKRFKALAKVEPRKVPARVPDMVAPIVAWRAWRCKEHCLQAIGGTDTWPQRKPLKARCVNGNTQHEAPGFECQCGVWGFKDQAALLAGLQEYKNIAILGEVYLWGRVVECAKGFRAQYAYPKELWLLNPKDEELGALYNVPVRV